MLNYYGLLWNSFVSLALSWISWHYRGLAGIGMNYYVLPHLWWKVTTAHTKLAWNFANYGISWIVLVYDANHGLRWILNDCCTLKWITMTYHGWWSVPNLLSLWRHQKVWRRYGAYQSLQRWCIIMVYGLSPMPASDQGLSRTTMQHSGLQRTAPSLWPHLEGMAQIWRIP